MRGSIIKILITANILLISSFAFSQSCMRCNARGKINFADSKVAGYGHGPVYMKCPVCSESININGGPAHYHPCPSCKGTGRISGSSLGTSSTSGGHNGSSSVGGYDGTLTPDEYFMVEELYKAIFQGVTESRTCTVCNGTNRCPGTGAHHYGNMSGFWNIDAPMPVYCFQCGGWGDCPNKNCLNGTEFYTRQLTESEKAEYYRRIQEIYDNAWKREYGFSIFSGTDSSGSTSNTTPNSTSNATNTGTNSTSTNNNGGSSHINYSNLGSVLSNHFHPNINSSGLANSNTSSPLNTLGLSLAVKQANKACPAGILDGIMMEGVTIYNKVKLVCRSTMPVESFNKMSKEAKKQYIQTFINNLVKAHKANKSTQNSKKKIQEAVYKVLREASLKRIPILFHVNSQKQGVFFENEVKISQPLAE